MGRTFQVSFSGYNSNVALPDYEISRPEIEFGSNFEFSPQFSFSGYTARTPAFCNACIQSLLGCLPTPKFPLSGCIPLILSSLLQQQIVSDVVGWLQCSVGNRWTGLALCAYDLYSNCRNVGKKRRKRNIDRAVNELVESMYPILQSIELATEVLGDESWLFVRDSPWLTYVLKPTMDDSSEAGTLISTTELSALLAAPPPNGASTEMVQRLVERLNNTLHGWNSGQLEPVRGANMASFTKTETLIQTIDNLNEVAIGNGFPSYLEAYNFASSEVNKIESWEEEAGVCAVVRIRIEQELALTRSAFLAKLEIENMEMFPLEQGDLEILIIDSGTGEIATHLFAIGNGSLSGSLTGGDGGWALPSEASGTIEWLIIPFSEAAPESDHVYDVGGTLRYSLDDENITVPLLPTLITVTPDPSLLVHYFWERFVVGDNPFTDEVEDSVPFTLGIAVKNAGHGVASSLKITSGQPEIIENESRLLTNFMIIGAMIDNESIKPSLTVMFGDVPPDTTKVARWQMISSLQGQFRGYSATFENTNPLGDPNLSVLDELEIHELIRNVKIYNSPEDDGALDFLVNDLDDLLAFPDTLYSSKTLERYNVSNGTTLSVRRIRTTLLEVRTITNTTGWVYYRYEDTQGILQNAISIVNVTKLNGYNVTSIPTENAWIAAVLGNNLSTDAVYLHILDNVSSTSEIVFNISLCFVNCISAELPYLVSTPSFDVTITSSGATNRSNATTIEYVIGSDVNLTCMITPAPPPNSEVRWNCSTGCLAGFEMGQTISLVDIKVREGGMIYCSVVVAGTVYYSEISAFKIIGVLVTEVTPGSGQSHSITTIIGQLLPQNEDNSTVTAVLIGGIPSDLLTSGLPASSFTVTVRAGSSFDPIPNANITIITQHSSYTAANITWTYNTPGNITTLVPSSGQTGTKVVIHGFSLMGSPSLPQVLLAGNEAIVDFVNATTILCRAPSAVPGNSSIIINFTQTVNGAIYNGPTFVKSNAWQQLADGKITRIVPNAVAANQTILLCGEHPLGDGNKTASVIIGGINATSFSSNSFVLSNYTCINATLPNDLTGPSNITIIANTGAIIQSLVDITFASVDAVIPAVGQYKTKLNISGTNLFNDITSTHVILVGVNATIESADMTSQSWIVVRAGKPYCATQEVCLSDTNSSNCRDIDCSSDYDAAFLTDSCLSNCVGQNISICFTSCTSGGGLNKTCFVECENYNIPVESPCFMECTIQCCSCMYNTVCNNNKIMEPSGQIVIVTQEFGLPFTLTSGGLIWSYNITSSITTVQPTFGQVGTRVAITGTNLYSFGTALDMVLINGSIAEVAYDNSSYVVFHVPVTSVGLVDITFVSNRRHSVQIVKAFEYKPAGIITSLVPSVGQYGTYVNISGVNLLGYGSSIMSVTFGSHLVRVINFTNSSIVVQITSHHSNTEIEAVNITIVSDTFASVSSAPNAWSFLVEGQVTSIIPTNGHIGTFVTITGTNLLGGGNLSSVYLDGASANVINTANDTIYLRLGTNTQRRSGYAPGEVILSIDTGAIVLSATNVNFTFYQTGLITGFSPLSGREGTYVTITGVNLLALGSKIIYVTIAGIDVPKDSIKYNGSDVNSVLVRVGQPNTTVVGNIRLLIDTGTIVVSNTTYNFSYVAPGIVTSVSPSEGVEGTGVLIEGHNLFIANSSVFSVHLAGSPVTRVVAATRTTIAVVAGPPMANNNMSAGLLITASDGSIARGGLFVYSIPHRVVLKGPSYGQYGTRVSIKLPANFEVLSVLVDNTPALFIAREVSSCVISIPRAQRQGTYYANIVIRNINSEVVQLVDKFTYMPEGVITKVSPNVGQQGTIVTITGDRLLGGGSFIAYAEFAGLEACVINSSNSLVVVEIVQTNDKRISIIGDIVLTADTGANITQLRAWAAVVPAVITAVQPNNGQYGTIVNITGSSLLQDVGLNIHSVTLAGERVDNILYVSSTHIQVQAPKASANISGVVKIELETGAYYESAINWTFVPPIVISSVFPTIGAIGSIICIEFSSNITEFIVTITLDGIQSQITKQFPKGRPNALEIIAPPGNYSNPVTISVETASGQLISMDDAFTVEELGEILAVSPRIIQQGIAVTITGYNFLGRSGHTTIDSVWLAGVKASNIISQHNSSVVVEAGYAPETLMGNVTIVLNRAAKVSSNSNMTLVQYYQSVITNVNPINGYNGTRFTISGVNLIYTNSTLDTVMIGNISATVEQCNDTFIVARAGEPNTHVINANLTIRVVSNSGAYIESLDSWRYLGMPHITRVEPSIASGGDIITIFGTDLVADNLSTILIGRMAIQELLYINTSSLRIRLPYGVNSSKLQTIEITATDGSTVTSAPIFRYSPINFTILHAAPTAGQNGTLVNITFNIVPPNITIVYLAGIMVRNISIQLNSVIVVAAYGNDVNGDTVVHTATGLILGLQNSWSYLPVFNSSHIIPNHGQEGTIITITVGPLLLRRYQIVTVALAEVPGVIKSIANNALIIQAGVSPPTNTSDIVLHFIGEIRLTIPLSWTYLPPIAITRLSNKFGYFSSIITIHGISFLNGQPNIVNVTKVTLAGVVIPGIVFFNDTMITCKITQLINSSLIPIVGPVTIQNSVGFTANTSGIVNFTYVQVTISSVLPSQGQNNTVVIIKGVGLLAGATSITTVWLNNVPVNNIINATNDIIAVQAGYSNTSTPIGDVTYHTNTGAVVTTPATWQYVASGVITSVTPSSGTEGTIVTIEGTNLFAGADSIDTVYLDGVKVSEVIMAFNTYIQVVAAASTSFSITFGPVSVYLSSGALVSSERKFKYSQPGIIANVTPLQGQNGTIVNISGNLLYRAEDNIVDIKLAGISASIIYISSSFIKVAARRPSKLESFDGPISIYAGSGAVLSYSMSHFTYLQEGFITSITPPQGQIGAKVEIKGRSLFGGGDRLLGVWLAGTPAFIQPGSTDDRIVVTAEFNDASSNRPIKADVLIVSNTRAHVRRINGWTYVQNGRIDAITPGFGQHGTRINISGEALLLGAIGLPQVTIGGVFVNVTKFNDALISGIAGNPSNNNSFNGAVSIVSSDGSILMTNYTWTYTDRSVISRFTPVTGSNSELIKITGTNLLASGQQIVQVTTAGIEVADIISQNNTLVVVQSGILTMAQTLTGPVVLTADTGAITESDKLYTFIKHCNLDQFILKNSSGFIECGNCNNVCAMCSGPSDSDCIECAPTSYLVQVFANSSKQCTQQCMNFSSDNRQCIESCSLGQYSDHFDAESTTFCRNCSDMCALNTECFGPVATQCSKCKYVRYQMECVPECPTRTFLNQFNDCIPCHYLCDQSAGCTGPTDSECISCANFTVATANDTCVEQCPPNYYSNNGSCLQCDPLCLAGCTGSGPVHCNECLFAGIKCSNNTIECVEKCDSSVYYLDGSTNLCEKCSEMCSTLDGCDGPSAGECHSCRMSNSSVLGAFKFNGMCVVECNLMSNNTVKYYNDPVTQNCQQCHVSCSRGCTSSGPSNCIAESFSKKENFEAGIGVISIAIGVGVLLLLLIIMCSVFLIKKRLKNKSHYHPQIPNVTHGTEMRYRNEMEDNMYENLGTIRGAPVARPVPLSSK